MFNRGLSLCFVYWWLTVMLGDMIKYREIYRKKIHISFLPLGLCAGFLIGVLLAMLLAWSLD